MKSERLKIVFLLACIALTVFVLWQMFNAQYGNVIFRITI